MARLKRTKIKHVKVFTNEQLTQSKIIAKITVKKRIKAKKEEEKAMVEQLYLQQMELIKDIEDERAKRVVIEKQQQKKENDIKKKEAEIKKKEIDEKRKQRIKIEKEEYQKWKDAEEQREKHQLMFRKAMTELDLYEQQR